MKQRILALLLALGMLLALATTASATTPEASLALDLRVDGEEIVVTLSLCNAEGVSNGRVTLRYDAASAPTQSRALLDCGVANLNDTAKGEISFAWVGSSIPAEKTALLEARFDSGKNASFVARATELYRNRIKLAATSAKLSYSSNPFTDISGHWAEKEILKVTRAGLFRGITETTFGPEMTLTRAMFVTLLHRLAGTPEAKQTTLRFADVRADAYYAEALAWAVENGIVTGHSETSFAPNDPVTRQEMATMFYRYADWSGEDVSQGASLTKFTDYAQIDAWAKTAMSWAVGKGILGGYPNGTILPRGSATRAEAAVVFCRFAGL